MTASGVVLAGGRSLRMGEDKARLCVAGRPLIYWAVAALQSVVQRVYCVGGDRPLALALGIPFIPDRVPACGPLGGIGSAMRALGTDILVLGCDMPLVHPGLLRLLIGAQGDADAVVPLNADEHEPLLALYRLSCADAVEAALASGRRRVTSFYDAVRVQLLEEHVWRAVDPDGRSFFNVNTPSDLDAVRSAMEEGGIWASSAATGSTL